MHSCTHTHTVNETHHDIVSLHLSFLTGQFLTLQFQTVRQTKNVMLVYVMIKTAIHTHTHVQKFKKIKITSEIIDLL